MAARLLFDLPDARGFVVATPNDPVAAWGIALPCFRAGSLRRDGAMRLLSVPGADSARAAGAPGVDISLSPGGREGIAVAPLGPLVPAWLWVYEDDDGEQAAGASLDVAVPGVDLGLAAMYAVPPAGERRSWFVPAGPVSVPVFAAGVSAAGRTVVPLRSPGAGSRVDVPAASSAGAAPPPAAPPRTESPPAEPPAAVPTAASRPAASPAPAPPPPAAVGELEVEQLVEVVGSLSGYGVPGLRARLLTSLAWEQALSLQLGVFYVDRHFTSPLSSTHGGSAGLYIEAEAEATLPAPNPEEEVEVGGRATYELTYKADDSSGFYRFVPEHGATLELDFAARAPGDLRFGADCGLELLSPAPAEPIELSIDPGIELGFSWANVELGADIEWPVGGAVEFELLLLLEVEAGPLTVGVEPGLSWTAPPCTDNLAETTAAPAEPPSAPEPEARAYLRLQDGGDRLDLVVRFEPAQEVPEFMLTYSTKQTLLKPEEEPRDVEIDGQAD